MKYKKMTNKERDSVISHLLQRLAMLEQHTLANENVLQMYVQYKDDSEKFNTWMTSIIEKAGKEQDEQK